MKTPYRKVYSFNFTLIKPPSKNFSIQLTSPLQKFMQNIKYKSRRIVEIFCLLAILQIFSAWLSFFKNKFKVYPKLYFTRFDYSIFREK